MRIFFALSTMLALQAMLFAEDAIPKLPNKIEFGETREVILWEERQKRGNSLIDFDSNSLLPATAMKIDAPRSTIYRAVQKWAIESGVDASCLVRKSFAGLIGFNIAAIPARDTDWEPSSSIMEQLSQTDIGYPCTVSAGRELPSTWIFRTTKNYGVLQILEITKGTENPSQYGDGIRIRYKLLK